MTAPYQPSILDRVVNRLFPTAQYSGLLPPEAQRDVQRQGLLGLGTSLLQAGAPQPYQGGTLANLGGALQQSQVNFPQMAQQALQIQAFKAHAQRQAALQHLGGQLAQSGGDPATMIRNAMPLFLDDPDTLKALAEAAKSLGAGEAHNLQEVKGITDTRLGSATLGQRGTGLVDSKGKLQQFYPEGQEPTKPSEILPFARTLSRPLRPIPWPSSPTTRIKVRPIRARLPIRPAWRRRLTSCCRLACDAGPALRPCDGGRLQRRATHRAHHWGARSEDSHAAARRTQGARFDRRECGRLRRQESAAITRQKLGLAPPGINASLYARDPWSPPGTISKRPALNFK